MNLSEDLFAGIDLLDEEDILQPFVCLLCYGVAVYPMKCQKCETVYCASCLPKSAFDKTIQCNYPDRPYECFKMCGSKDVVPLSRLERNILNSLSFRC